MATLEQIDPMSRLTALRIASLVLEEQKNIASKANKMSWWGECSQAIILIEEMITEERQKEKMRYEMVRDR